MKEFDCRGKTKEEIEKMAQNAGTLRWQRKIVKTNKLSSN